MTPNFGCLDRPSTGVFFKRDGTGTSSRPSADFMADVLPSNIQAHWQRMGILYRELYSHITLRLSPLI